MIDTSAAGPPEPNQQTLWTKDRKLARGGHRDLEYLPKRQTDWNATLAALAYSARRLAYDVGLGPPPDLNLWAAMHGLPGSGRYEDLGRDALVLWHGTSAVRAAKIHDHGLMCKRGVWASTEPRIAHGYTRSRSQAFQAGSAMIVLVMSREQWDGRATCTEKIAQFHTNIPADCVEYILWPERIEFLGAMKARSPRRWGTARFTKRSGRWEPASQPPVRLDAARTYRTLNEWLELSVHRVLTTLGQAAAIEVFSSLYATLDPWDALTHQQVFDAIERVAAGECIRSRVTFFSLVDRAA